MNKLYAVGIGPGDYSHMTLEAAQVLETCDVIVGYTVYVDLVKEHFPGKEFLTTPMRQEERRCRMAFEEAAKGRTVAMICSGDAGVYGMAGLLLELGREFPDCEVEVISGVTAALSGAAVLGAPLIHDFAVISLSDLLTPWELIEKRLACAAEGDFSICIYNPSSRKRNDYLKKACRILLETKAPDTVCGLVRNIGREGQSFRVLTLAELAETETDMFTTVFVGNSATRVIDGRMVTPRGYRSEREDGEERRFRRNRIPGQRAKISREDLPAGAALAFAPSTSIRTEKGRQRHHGSFCRSRAGGSGAAHFKGKTPAGGGGRDHLRRFPGQSPAFGLRKTRG